MRRRLPLQDHRVLPQLDEKLYLKVFAQPEPPGPRRVEIDGASAAPHPRADSPTPTQRPLDSRLGHDKLGRVFGPRLPDWRQALRLCMRS